MNQFFKMIFENFNSQFTITSNKKNSDLDRNRFGRKILLTPIRIQPKLETYKEL